MMMNEVLEMVKEFVEVYKNDSDMMKNFREGLKEVCKIEKGDGRKKEVRDILEEGGRYSIKEIGERLNISDKNVSSILSYLRKSGMKICTDYEGRKYIEK